MNWVVNQLQGILGFGFGFIYSNPKTQKSQAKTPKKLVNHKNLDFDFKFAILSLKSISID